MGKHQRDKGKRGELKHRDVLRKLGFTDAHRGVQYAGGKDSPDVVGIPGVHHEVKYENRRFAVVRMVNETVLTDCETVRLETGHEDVYAFRASSLWSTILRCKYNAGRCATKWVQNKRGLPQTYMEQAKRDAGDKVPLLVLRENGMGLMDEVWIVRVQDMDKFAAAVVAGKEG